MSGQINFGAVNGPTIVPARQSAGAAAWAFSAAGAVAMAVAYFLAAKLSLALLEEADGVAVFWPAAGLASGVLIGFGSAARWPVIAGVMVATVAANLLGDRNIWSSIFFAIANAGEATVVAGLIQWFYSSPFELNALRHVLGLFAATIAATVTSGIVGTFGFVFFYGSAASASTIWFQWFASDALGTITIAPLIIGFASLLREFPRRREIAEGLLSLGLVIDLCAALILMPNQRWTLELAITAFCPLIVWIASRLRPFFTAAATFICAITILWMTTFALGVFGDPRVSIDQRILSAQATLLAISFGALILAALFSERRLHEIALLEREARLQDALRAGGVLAFDWDLPADEVRHSQNATETLGIKPNQVLSSAEWLKHIHPDDQPGVMACLHGVRSDNPSYFTTFRYLPQERDREVWLEQIAIAEFDAAGHIKRVQGLTTDITERRRSELEISRAHKAAELANQAKSSFLAAASHDLRQPLQTLRFLQGALAPHHPDGEGRKVVEAIGRSLDTLSSMLSSLLDVNRLESGSLRPTKSDFAINEIFDSVENDFLRLVGEKGLHLRVVRSGLWVHSDKRMLEEMIRNLLSNSVRYTDDGKILLGCRRSGDKIRVDISDSGIGIAADQLPHIFDEYYQSTAAAQRGGFGLGLAIVRRLGDLLDHRINVRSAPGKGTCVSIEVPLGRARVPDEEVQDRHGEGISFAGTVLVIEDETSVRSALNRLLKLRGIGSFIVATGNDALALVAKGIRPDLVLSDYNLRGSLNGVESIKAVRSALAWNVPAIVMTGDIQTKTIEAIASHDVSVVIKPFAAEELLQLMTRLQGASDSGGAS
jgi:signal transduction histidine kinase/integral membrane sensor domain MASE1/CheY-like chemotaxis protein